jgi:hypothetical protein
MSVETRRSVKSHASDAWKRRLRADVLERVRAHRAALLTRARGDGSSPGDGLRTLLNDGLREILHDAIDTETRRRMSQDPDDSDDGMWDDVIADPRTDGRAASAACARTDHPTTSGSGPKGSSRSRRESISRDVSISPLVKSPPSSRATWNELLALGFTDVEYDSLMAEMHRGFEEEIREEEARMLALELEKTELLENEETRDACERHERWMMAGDGAGDEGTGTPNEEVLCPVCLESRLLQTRGSIFCKCGGVRLSRADPASEGNAGRALGSEAFSLTTVRARLAGLFATHGENGCDSSLVFAMKQKFGTSALYAECREKKCAFLEVVM